MKRKNDYTRGISITLRCAASQTLDAMSPLPGKHAYALRLRRPNIAASCCSNTAHEQYERVRLIPDSLKGLALAPHSVGL